MALKLGFQLQMISTIMKLFQNNVTSYIIYYNDRSGGYGGIMIAISKQFTSSKIALLQTNCEILYIVDTNHYE